MLPDFTTYNAIVSPVFVLTEGPDGDVVYAFMNTAGCRRLACTPQHVVGKSAAQIFTGRTADLAHMRQREAWASGCAMEYELPFVDGNDDLCFLTNLTPQRDADGRLTHIVGMSRDITQRKRLEQVQAMNDAMANELEDFVRFAAHDLRSPIANVKMLADMLRDGFVDRGDGKTEIIQMIEDVSDRALDLVSDVLTQAVAVRTETAPAQFSFRTMCDNIMATLDPAHHHTIAVSDVEVVADMTAVQIIVRNLVDNAVKHAGLDHITLEIEVVDSGDGRLCIAVTDNGQGFGGAALAFLQDETASSAQSGFGLLGVRRLVRARGGKIRVGEARGQTGARVNVDLPGHVVAMDADTRKAMARQKRFI
ncbi:MAG: PAS domain-containing sensor histidine kinase [Pseudomonadota bacterium]